MEIEELVISNSGRPCTKKSAVFFFSKKTCAVISLRAFYDPYKQQSYLFNRSGHGQSFFNDGLERNYL